MVWTKEYWGLFASLCTLNLKIWKLAYSFGTSGGHEAFLSIFFKFIGHTWKKKKKSSETHDFTSGDLKVSYSGRKHMDEGP